MGKPSQTQEVALRNLARAADRLYQACLLDHFFWSETASPRDKIDKKLDEVKAAGELWRASRQGKE